MSSNDSTIGGMVHGSTTGLLGGANVKLSPGVTGYGNMFDYSDVNRWYTGGPIGMRSTINSNNFKIVNADFTIGAQGSHWKLEDMLKLSKRARFMRDGAEIAMPKAVWDLIELYMQDSNGYSDLLPHEFIDKALAPKEKQDGEAGSADNQQR